MYPETRYSNNGFPMLFGALPEFDSIISSLAVLVEHEINE
jgi:hypothetical protein